MKDVLNNKWTYIVALAAAVITCVAQFLQSHPLPL